MEALVTELLLLLLLDSMEKEEMKERISLVGNWNSGGNFGCDCEYYTPF